MQLHGRVARAREAAAAQAARRHAEVAAVLLHEDVGRQLGRAEQRVLRLVDAEVLRDAVREGGVGVVPARLQLGELDVVRRVAVHLVRATGARAGDSAQCRRIGLEQCQRAARIHVEIVEGTRRGQVVAGLRRGVDRSRPAAGPRSGAARRRGRACRVRGARRTDAPRCSRRWFQRVSPCGPKKSARMLLSTPCTSHPCPEKWDTISDPIRPFEPVTNIVFT